jgi:hypothetical protein
MKFLEGECAPDRSFNWREFRASYVGELEEVRGVLGVAGSTGAVEDGQHYVVHEHLQPPGNDGRQGTMAARE